jgi:hypothetical protein
MPTGISENLTLFRLQFFQANGKNFRIQDQVVLNYGAVVSAYKPCLSNLRQQKFNCLSA